MVIRGRRFVEICSATNVCAGISGVDFHAGTNMIRSVTLGVGKRKWCWETEAPLFARVKKSGPYQYVRVVHNERVEGRVRQRVVATLGRLDVLKESGQLDGLLESRARFSDHLAVLNAPKSNRITPSLAVAVTAK